MLFTITETCEYTVQAESAQEALEAWLAQAPDFGGRVEFVGVTERSVADANGNALEVDDKL